MLIQHQTPSNDVLDFIGLKVVIIVYHLDGDNQPEEDTKERYFGILEAVVILEDQTIVKLHGCDAEAYKYTEEKVLISPTLE